MKIAFLLSHCHYHGSSKHVLEISKYLCAWGHEVHVFAKTCDREKFLRFHKIPALGKEYSLAENISVFTIETLLMGLKRKEFDVTISQPGRFLTPNVCHVRFLTKSALKVSKTEGKRTSFTSKLLTSVEKIALKRCRHVIAMTDFVKRDLLKNYHVDHEKVSVIYDGVDVDLFSPDIRKKYRIMVRESLNIGKDDIVSFTLCRKSVFQKRLTVLNTFPEVP
ncbi:MAG: glycosyltransferase [Candidatus Micrarchaeota archaeon]|nr:glycosyltransferase [Candidatus Micrarchaeota archaeon]